MAMHLVVRVAVPLGEGTLAVRHGALVTTGPLALRCDDRALIAALEALGTVVSVARHEASATVALPRGPRAAAPLVALVEALAAPGAGARPR